MVWEHSGPMALNGSPTKTNSSLHKLKVLILFGSRTLNPYNQCAILKCYCLPSPGFTRCRRFKRCTTPYNSKYYSFSILSLERNVWEFTVTLWNISHSWCFKNKNVMYCKSCVENKLAFPMIEITSDVHIFFGLQCTPGFKGKNSFLLQARHILLE